MIKKTEKNIISKSLIIIFYEFDFLFSLIYQLEHFIVSQILYKDFFLKILFYVQKLCAFHFIRNILIPQRYNTKKIITITSKLSLPFLKTLRKIQSI